MWKLFYPERDVIDFDALSNQRIGQSELLESLNALGLQSICFSRRGLVFPIVEEHSGNSEAYKVRSVVNKFSEVVLLWKDTSGTLRKHQPSGASADYYNGSVFVVSCDHLVNDELL